MKIADNQDGAGGTPETCAPVSGEQTPSLTEAPSSVGSQPAVYVPDQSAASTPPISQAAPEKASIPVPSMPAPAPGAAIDTPPSGAIGVAKQPSPPNSASAPGETVVQDSDDPCRLPSDSAANAQPLPNSQPSPDAISDRVLEHAQQDLDAVKDEIKSIESCRSNIFIGTLGAVGASAMTTAALVAQSITGGSRYDVWFAVLFGSSVGMVLLTIGIIATLEKARAINCRRGFIVTLTHMIRTGTLPTGYRGWAEYRTARNDCRSRRALTVRQYERIRKRDKDLRDGAWRFCDAQAQACLEDTEIVESCWRHGHRLAAQTHPKRRVFPDLLNSFTSLSTFIYSMLYLVIGCVDMYSFHKSFSGLYSSKDATFYSYLVGAVIGFVYACFTEMVSHRLSESGGRSSFFHIIKRMCVYSLPVLFVALAAMIAGNFEWRSAHVWFAIRLCMAVSIVAMGMLALAQVNSMTIGRNSLESHYHAWQQIILRCKAGLLDPLPKLIDKQCAQRKCQIQSCKNYVPVTHGQSVCP